MTSNTLLSRAVLLAVVALCGPGRSAVAVAADHVDVQVWSIRATHADDTISPELKPLAAALKKAFKFKGYRLIKSETKTAEVGKALTWTLPASYRLAVKPMDATREKIRLEVVVTRREQDKDRKKLSTTLAVKPGKFQLMGGWKLEGDDVLILAVGAKAARTAPPR